MTIDYPVGVQCKSHFRLAKEINLVHMNLANPYVNAENDSRTVTVTLDGVNSQIHW